MAKATKPIKPFTIVKVRIETIIDEYLVNTSLDVDNIAFHVKQCDDGNSDWNTDEFAVDVCSTGNTTKSTEYKVYTEDGYNVKRMLDEVKNSNISVNMKRDIINCISEAGYRYYSETGSHNITDDYK